MLPEAHESRALARYLWLRAKLEMHSGRWDELTRTMQTMFRLAEMVGHAGDLLVCRLLGSRYPRERLYRICIRSGEKTRNRCPQGEQSRASGFPSTFT